MVLDAIDVMICIAILGIVLHNYKKDKSVKEQISDIMMEGLGVRDNSENEFVIRAMELEKRINAIINSVRVRFPKFAEDIKVKEYTATIDLLITKEITIVETLELSSKTDIPRMMKDVDYRITELDALDAERKKALKEPYLKRKEELKGQLKLIERLQDQKELLGLRVASANHALEKLLLNLANVTSMSSVDDVGAISIFNKEVDELNLYHTDLVEAYNEICS